MKPSFFFLRNVSFHLNKTLWSCIHLFCTALHLLMNIVEKYYVLTLRLLKLWTLFHMESYRSQQSSMSKVMAILGWPSEFSIRVGTFVPKTHPALVSWWQMCNSMLSTVHEFSSILRAHLNLHI